MNKEEFAGWLLDRLSTEPTGRDANVRFIVQALDEYAKFKLEPIKELLEACLGCDLIYRAADGYYGIGQKPFGVEITDGTNVKEIVEAAISSISSQRTQEKT